MEQGYAAHSPTSSCAQSLGIGHCGVTASVMHLRFQGCRPHISGVTRNKRLFNRPEHFCTAGIGGARPGICQ